MKKTAGCSAAGWPVVAVLMGLSLVAGCAPREKSITLFEDATAKSGLGTYVGMTHGAAWGDFDGDGLPDLYLTNHLNRAQLFRNLGGGRFAEVTRDVISPDAVGGDKHGAAWADFNNDGKPDLVQLTGAIRGAGVEPKRLFVNEMGAHGGISLVERAAELGVDNLPGRTRMPLWFDVNHDGKLDLLQGAEGRLDPLTPPFLFTQQTTRFTDATVWLKPNLRSMPFCVLTELNADPYPEVVCRLVGKGQALQIFDTRTLPARTLDLLPQTAYDDLVAGDFDNDGAIDLFLARRNPGGRIAWAQSDRNTLTAQVELTPGTLDQLTALRFRTAGKLEVVLAGQGADDIAPADIRLGANAAHPASLRFDVEAAAVPGLPPAPGGDRGSVLIGSPKPTQWQVGFEGRPKWFTSTVKAHYLAIRIRSSAPIDKIEALGDSAKDEAAPARLFMNRGGTLVEESEKRGVNARPIAAVNAVAGDFDNDMDLDIFVLGSGDAGKTPNLLLLNNGKSKFDVVRDAGGAAGWLVGVGDSVTTADIDGDGFLDLLTASGSSMGRNLGLPSDNGRYQLFRNVANGNHWLKIDLVGTHSNRDGIGARVVVAAGGVTQTRFQDGGVHERGQNHARLHFGLGKNAAADSVTVKWPSGKVQLLNAIPTNRVLRIEEPR